jgi:hypothetical protein
VKLWVSPDCAKLVVGASGAAPTSEAAGRRAIAVSLSMSVFLAQIDVFKNQNKDARFRKASARRDAAVVTKRTTDSA